MLPIGILKMTAKFFTNFVRFPAGKTNEFIVILLTEKVLNLKYNLFPFNYLHISIYLYNYLHISIFSENEKCPCFSFLPRFSKIQCKGLIESRYALSIPIRVCSSVRKMSLNYFRSDRCK